MPLPAASRASKRACSPPMSRIAAGEAGLAALLGSSPDTGVAGFTLGGGLGWLGRRYGLACNSVRAIEVVTADGRQRRVDADNDPELFFALRGGGGSFGAVTAARDRALSGHRGLCRDGRLARRDGL